MGDARSKMLHDAAGGNVAGQSWVRSTAKPTAWGATSAIGVARQLSKVTRWIADTSPMPRLPNSMVRGHRASGASRAAVNSTRSR